MNTTAGVLAFIVALFLQFIPLLAVPFAFRLAGGTLSKAHEIINNGHQKVRQSGWFGNRKEQAQKNWAQQKGHANASYWNQREAKYNAALNGGAGFMNAARRRRLGIEGRVLPGGMQVSKRVGVNAAKASQASAIASGDIGKILQATGTAHDDAALKAGMFGQSYGDQVEKVTQHEVDLAKRNGTYRAGDTERTARAYATRGANAWAATGIGYGKAAQEAAGIAAAADGYVFQDGREMQESIYKMTGQDSAGRARLWGSMRGASGARLDVKSAGFQAGLDSITAIANANGNVDNAVFVRKLADGSRIRETADEHFVYDTIQAARGASNPDLARMNGSAAKNLKNNMIAALKNGDDQLVAQVTAKVENLHDAGYAMPEQVLTILHEVPDNAATRDRFEIARAAGNTSPPINAMPHGDTTSPGHTYQTDKGAGYTRGGPPIRPGGAGTTPP